MPATALSVIRALCFAGNAAALIWLWIVVGPQDEFPDSSEDWLVLLITASACLSCALLAPTFWLPSDPEERTLTAQLRKEEIRARIAEAKGRAANAERRQ